MKKIYDTIERYSMLKKNARVLLCVSGGPDSVAMLSLFDALKKDLSLELFIAHLNHKLRGRDSDKDQAYVENLARRYKLPLIAAQEDVKRSARAKRLSLEDAARRARYDFFLKSAKELDIDSIATAHTRDDQAETVLMRLLRGSGLRGLKGISPKRHMDGFLIVRPLIDISRKEIESYLREKGIRPRIDATNLKTDFFRNKVRLRLLPLLERGYSPKIKELLASLAELLDKDYEYISVSQKSIFKRLARLGRKGCVSFSLSVFKRQGISVQRALARESIRSLSGTLDSIEYRHWQEVESLVNKRPAGSVVHLPGNIEAKKTKTVLAFAKVKEHRRKEQTHGPSLLNIPGTTDFGKKILKARVLSRCSCVSRHPKTVEYFDMDRLNLPLSMRLRRSGDMMVPLGMKGTKKVRDIFIDEKIPLSRRASILVVVSACGNILWLCGIKMSDRFKINARTKKILRLELLHK